MNQTSYISENDDAYIGVSAIREQANYAKEQFEKYKKSARSMTRYFIASLFITGICLYYDWSASALLFGLIGIAGAVFHANEDSNATAWDIAYRNFYLMDKHDEITVSGLNSISLSIEHGKS